MGRQQKRSYKIPRLTKGGDPVRGVALRRRQQADRLAAATDMEKTLVHMLDTFARDALQALSRNEQSLDALPYAKRIITLFNERSA